MERKLQISNLQFQIPTPQGGTKVQISKIRVLAFASRLAGLAFGIWGLGFSCASAATAKINIDASQPGPRVNPGMYGIFLEEINFGIDGGLYGELIRNRGFEDAKPPEGFTYRDGKWQDAKGYDARFSRFGYVTNGLPSWSLIQEGEARGSMSLDLTEPLDPATPRSLRLDVEEIGTGRLGIANGGFWGIGVADGGERERSVSLFRQAGVVEKPLISQRRRPARNVRATTPHVRRGPVVPGFGTNRV